MQRLAFSDNHEMIQKLVSWLDSGSIVALQGIGGTHYVAKPSSGAIHRLRSMKRAESEKPFAVMFRNITIAAKYVNMTESDRDLLSSQRRPIVILPLKQEILGSNDLPLISPNLTTLGLMLPYSGIYQLIFRELTSDFLVVTSANPSQLPMPIDPDQIIEITKTIADYILVHNRPIAQRVDDSVLRSYGGYYKIIRRARGFAPTPLFMKNHQSTKSILALGAEGANTTAIFHQNYLVPSQHIGNLKTIESLQAQRSATHHLLNLYDIEPERIVIDLHPRYLNREEIDTYATPNTEIVELQHHAAHAYSLLADLDLTPDDSYLIWSCDGYGYGSDGQAWGGELLEINKDGWNRVSSIQPVSYLGGDQNTIYPDRMLTIYLEQLGINAEVYFKNHQSNFQHGQTELQYLRSKLFDSTTQTTSMGRLLDAVAALLDICHYRSYRGEPAIKLEDIALSASHTIESESFVDAGKLANLKLFEKAYELRINGLQTSEIASWVLHSIGRSMADVISDLDLSISNIGFTGGVAYNMLIEQELQRGLQEMKHEITYLKHRRVPPGDGGISIGQAYFGGLNL